MILPEDLPWILEYQVGKTVRVSLPRRPVSGVGTSGKTDAEQVCPQIPLGCSGWRLAGEKAFRPLEALPQAWRPFLMRERPGPMDFRPKRLSDLEAMVTE